jgi:hypothetical protein
MMALRLTDNDISSERVSQQVEHLSSKAREAKNMALELRQKHLDAKLQVKDRPARASQEVAGGRGRSREVSPVLARVDGEDTAAPDSPDGWRT